MKIGANVAMRDDSSQRLHELTHLETGRLGARLCKRFEGIVVGKHVIRQSGPERRQRRAQRIVGTQCGLGLGVERLQHVAEEIVTEGRNVLQEGHALTKQGDHAGDERTAGVLCFSQPPQRPYAAVEVLAPDGDLCTAAAGLYAAMHRLDALKLSRIVAEPLPEHGLGRAINDRLRRAAAAE